ncbi:hypothetical protein DPEC_G00222850 [Dallia pectoralis]|uniref:Uncharacterized protein n=1 Tax=Dallia pectoralis TaxID=75939 RepID=A0ACC2G032_DALPE|nr:hypothetical protein DPEC_G00222850 [Dallia pectoralis]
MGMYAREIYLVSCLLISVLGTLGMCSVLKVRVRLSDGLVADQMLEANREMDTITVEFQQGDGTHNMVVFDFKRNVRIVRALILGEPERGQTQYQVLCFVSRLNHHEVIPTESMVHLRQKNPHLVRTAEERRGLEHLHMDMAVNMSRAGHLDTLIHSVCKGAYQGFYARKSDWLDKEVVEFEPLLQTAAAAGLHRCPSTLDLWQPCTCSYRLRLEWLPCLLKYCRGRRDTAVKANPYKCGIRSCSQSYRFDYYVPHRVLCPWDEET